MHYLIACASIFLMLFESIVSKYQRSNAIASGDFTNLQVNRTIELTSNIIKISTSILIRNNLVDPADVYRLPLLKNSTRSMLHFEAKMHFIEEDSSFKLKVHKQLKSDEDFIFYDLTFRSDPMNNEEERIIEIIEYYFGQYELLPKKITLLEDQFFRYEGIYNYLSFYLTNSQITRVKLPVKKNDILEYTKDNAALDGETIIYSLDENPIEPLKIFKLQVHYLNNIPYAVFNYAEKIFEVSHWGNIAAEERYQIEHIGAKLEGEFGRIDYNDYNKKGGRNSLQSLKAKLPLRSNNLWYRDEIGNVSTSSAEREWDQVNLDLELRFPLLGGWKSNYNTGYNLPTKFQVDVEDRGYVLTLPFGLPYSDLMAKNYTVRVILPENSSIIKVNLPIDAQFKISYEKYFSFLDFFGRTMVVITMSNSFDIHKVPIEVSHYF